MQSTLYNQQPIKPTSISIYEPPNSSDRPKFAEVIELERHNKEPLFRNVDIGQQFGPSKNKALKC